MASSSSVTCLVGAAHGRRDEDDAVAADEQHGDVTLRRPAQQQQEMLPSSGLIPIILLLFSPVDLFVRLLVDLDGGHGLLHVAQDHVQVLVVSLKPKADKLEQEPKMTTS